MTLKLEVCVGSDLRDGLCTFCADNGGHAGPVLVQKTREAVWNDGTMETVAGVAGGSNSGGLRGE